MHRPKYQSAQDLKDDLANLFGRQRARLGTSKSVVALL